VLSVAFVDGAVLLGAAVVAGSVASVAPVEVLATALAVYLLAALQDARPRRWICCVAAALLVASAWRARAQSDAFDAVREASGAVLPRPVRCAGRAEVLGCPVEVRGTLRWTAQIRDASCDEGASDWSGPATLYGGPADLARGDELEVVAQLAAPERFWNAATGDPRPAQARRGTLRSGGLVDARIVRRGWGLHAWIDRLRARVRGRIEATFAGDTAPMARAIVLGESDLSPEDDAAFRASGLSHLLAVSGMHLVLIVAGIARALRAVLVRVEMLAARIDAGRLAAGIGVVLAWVYADFAGAGGSTLRASWMMTASLGAEALGRRSEGPRAFGLSLLAMAALDPLVAFDVSFALSAGATAGLLAFASPIGDRLCAWVDPADARPWVRSVSRAAGVTLAATLPCAPILARFAPTLPLGGVAANLLAVPLGEAIALPLCLLHALVGPWHAAETGCALASSGALGMVRAVARAFVSQRWLLVNVPPPTSWQMGAATVALIALTMRRARGTFLAAAAAALLVFEVMACRAGAPHGLLRATFLDVGQGDAALVDLPDGSAMVIDGGGLVGSPIDPGERALAPTLRARRRREVALAVLSHPHPDHFTGLASGLARVRVRALWDTGQGEREGVKGAYATWLLAARSAQVPVVRPPTLCGEHDIGGARVSVLAPCPEPSPDRGPNDNSLVLRIAYGSRAFLFVGDAEREEEADLLALGAERLRADVLKVGHHGSRTSTSPAFLRAVSPAHAVISVGVRNRFGHPHPTTLATLEKAGVPVYRTDRDGEVVATTDGRSLEVHAAR
jgi:competence protein ComEC